jgi:hypothetical protein
MPCPGLRFTGTVANHPPPHHGTGWTTSKPPSIFPVVAFTTSCMQNNQVPAGRELGFRKTLITSLGSATRLGRNRVSSSFYVGLWNRIW